MVLAIRVETTSPVFSFLFFRFSSAMAAFRLRAGLLGLHPLPQNGPHARDVLAHVPHLLEAVGLAHRHLKLQPEGLFFHIPQLSLNFMGVEAADLISFHGSTP